MKLSSNNVLRCGGLAAVDAGDAVSMYVVAQAEDNIYDVIQQSRMQIAVSTPPGCRYHRSSIEFYFVLPY